MSPVRRDLGRTGAAVSLNEATQRDELRGFFDLLIATAMTTMVVDGIASIAIGSLRWFAPVIVGGLFGAWIAAGPRRAVDHENVEALVNRVAIVLIAWILVVVLFQPFLALALAPAYLVPIGAAMPYLEGRRLRMVMGLAWVAAVGSVLAHLLPDDSSAPAAVQTLVEVVALAVVIGVVFIVLYRSAEGLKASGREFRRLFQLSSDLAETTDPGLLGGLVARHLAEATGFDDCVIYALAHDTERLVPFGSHPVERSLETAPESIATRPMLARVANDQSPIVIDVSDERADPLERDRLRVLGRMAMLLLPLTAQERLVGIAELTSAGHHSIDVRRLALARTLTFEAAMAIENGRLYQELRDRSLHDPLTGLANRSLFYDRAEHALARLDRGEGGGVAVLFMDIDDFKTINDTLGHARGDRLLTILGERLRTVVRAADTVARLGGDEFAVLLEDVASVDAALAVAARTIDALAEPFDLGGQPTRTSVSIGVAFRSPQGARFDDLLQQADAAMYEAKAAGKGRTVLFAGGGIAQDPGRAAPTAEVMTTPHIRATIVERPTLRAGRGDTNPTERSGDDEAAIETPDDAAQRHEVRRFISVLIVATLTGGMADAIAAIAVNSPRWFATVVLAVVLATWLAAVPRRAVDRENVKTIVSQVAIVLTGAIVLVALIQPFLALVLAPATMLPVALGLPYLTGRSLRHLMVSGWTATVVIVLASLLPDDAAVPGVVVTLLPLWALAVVIGLVFFLLYRSAEGLKASGREFHRLFELSSDLAEATDPGMLGELVARHLADATGFDDCVIYALAPGTGQLVPFGSHPVERSLETDPEPLAKRPVLERVARGRAPIVIDASDGQADPLERDRLRGLGRMAMLLMPLLAQERVVGIAELTSAAHHSIDGRLLALARTLTVEAAMAIENGRLYQELRHRSLHDPLTGLANRSLFYDRADHALVRLARHDEAGIAILFMDVDHFKMINDTLGHARGDRLLTLVAERLRTVIRAGDSVARLGGDEFALLLEDVASPDMALAVAARAIDAIAVPFDLAGQSTSVSVSIGVAFGSATDTTVENLVQNADDAMYAAKAAGRGRAVLSAVGGSAHVDRDPIGGTAARTRSASIGARSE